MPGPIKVDVINDACQKPHAIEINGRPVQVCNDLFDGQVCAIHRPPDDKPFRYEKTLEGTRRRCEFQFQVRFKEAPQGVLWVGGEVSGPLALNFVTRRIFDIFLQVMRQVSGPHIQYSTGMDDSSSKDAYIHYPALEVFSVVLATQVGQKAPVLGSRELSKAKNTTPAARSVVAELLTGQQCKDYIFTFTLKSMYVDVLKWAVVNIPGLPPISFETFWGSRRTFKVLVYSGGVEGPKAVAPKQHFLDLTITWRMTSSDEPEDTDDWGERAANLATPLKGQDDDWETSSFFSCQEDLTPCAEYVAAPLRSSYIFGARPLKHSLLKLHPKIGCFSGFGALISKICLGR